MALSNFVCTFLLILMILTILLSKNVIASEDIFGIEEIYPTKKGGEKWHMDMINPLSDNRFDPYNLLAMEDRNPQDPPLFKIIRNEDNSWKMIPLTDYSSIRMNILTDDGYDRNKIETFDHSKLAEKGYIQSQRDWKNIEMTGYIKLNEPKTDKKDGLFQWYNRGGIHDKPSDLISKKCEGVGYKGNLFFDGKNRFAKEQWHVSYEFLDKKDGTEEGYLNQRWIGFKFIVYNIETNSHTFVKMENWLDEGNEKSNNQNSWKKVNEYIDNGNLGKKGKECGGKKDQIITWGGPIATFRWDEATDVDFKFLSVREIDPLTGLKK